MGIKTAASPDGRLSGVFMNPANNPQGGADKNGPNAMLNCLSNISDKICRDCAKEFEFLKFTDGRVLSYEEKLIKPDPAIYRLLLKRYDLKAEECIFIDDLENNVNAARKFGIYGIVFQNQPQTESEIKAIRRSFE